MNSLEIIDTLCSVTTQLSDLVRALNTELQQADIANELKEEMMRKQEDTEKTLDSVEYKLRRSRM